jgi:hypothetical protein
MGWLFTSGSTRRGLIAGRIEGWERTQDDGTIIKSECLAHCFRGGSFSGGLWSVWERTYVRNGEQAEPSQRWIQCDLLQYSRSNDGWGYKDIEECMGPCYYSCPLKYLDMVPLDEFGGNAEWRELVTSYHEQQREKRRARRLAAK